MPDATSVATARRRDRAPAHFLTAERKAGCKPSGFPSNVASTVHSTGAPTTSRSTIGGRPVTRIAYVAHRWAEAAPESSQAGT